MNAKKPSRLSQIGRRRSAGISINERNPPPLVLIVGLLFLALGAIFIISLALGAVPLPLGQILHLFFNKLTGVDDPSLARVEAIVWHIRLPRSVGAVIAGIALALSGAAVQGIFRNPMASPNILGISAGSSLGAVIVIVSGLQLVHSLILPVAAFAGAMLTASFVYVIGSSRGRSHLLFVILAGLGVSSFLGGLVSAFLLFSNRYEISQFLFWTMGGLDGLLSERLIWPLPFITIGLVILLRMGKALNLLALGDEQAHSLGLHVGRSKMIILALSSLLTAMAIAIAGPVSFVGLMVPHFIRLLFGADHRRLLPLSALGGGIFLLLSDIVGRRLIPPYEIKTGIITSILGAPYFIFLIIRYQRRGRLT